MTKSQEGCCKQNCPDYGGMEILHKEQCNCPCHSKREESVIQLTPIPHKREVGELKIARTPAELDEILSKPVSEWEEEWKYEMSRPAVWPNKLKTPTELGGEHYDILDERKVKHFIRQNFIPRQQLLDRVEEVMRKKHAEFMISPVREDIANCKEVNCNHYILGADDLHSVLMSALKAEIMKGV